MRMLLMAMLSNAHAYGWTVCASVPAANAPYMWLDPAVLRLLQDNAVQGLPCLVCTSRLGAGWLMRWGHQVHLLVD